MLDEIISNHKQVYIMCVPLWYRPEPSPEQSNCVVEKCPECNTNMWVSEKKRIIREKAKQEGRDNIKMLCGMCIVKHQLIADRDNSATFTEIDISKFE